MTDPLRTALQALVDEWRGRAGTRRQAVFTLCADNLAALLAAEEPSVGPTAGDLFIVAADAFVDHAESCSLDACDVCVARINQMRLARKVWQSSRHQAASTPAAEEPSGELAALLHAPKLTAEIRRLEKALSAAEARIARMLDEQEDRDADARERGWDEL